MICNRLTSPAPLVHVGDWARTWAVPEILGIAPASLNDDKLGRTLDAIAPRLDQITSAVAVRAITAFDIDISRLHWDMTSFSLHGAYDDTDEDYPEPRYGHPKDRRPDLLQVQAGIAAAGDGGIPVYHRAYDGGAAEVSQVTGAMTELKKIAGPRTFLLIGDSKLISYDNVAAVTGKGCTFLAPASKTYVKAAELAACDLAQATEVSYIAQRDEHKSPEQRGRWHVLEDARPFHDPQPQAEKGPAHHAAPHLRALQRPRQRRRRQPRQETRPRQGRPGPPGPRPRRPLLPRRESRHRTAPADHRSPQDRPLPALHRHHHPGRRRRPGGAEGGRSPAAAPAAAGPANPPSPGGSTRTPSTPKPPPTAGTRCSPTSTPASPPPRCCCATRARKPSNAATATSKARSRSPRCS